MSLDVGMVRRKWPVLSYKCAVVFRTCMVGEFVRMSLSGLQSWRCICVRGRFVGGGMKRVLMIEHYHKSLV